MAWDWEKIVATKTTARESVDIVMDRAWGQRLGEAQLRVAVLQEQVTRSPSDTTLTGEIEELTGEIEELTALKPEKVCTFVFKSIAADRYERLVNAHPPTQEQRTRAAKLGRSVSFNEDTFARALVAACMIEPRLTRAQIDELWTSGADDDDTPEDERSIGSRFSSAELAALFMTAQAANMGRQRVE